jgi:NADPH:quinone reductase
VPVAAALALVRGGQVASGALWAAGIHKGDRVLITAAAGGVGHLAVQLARSRGAGRVIGAVGSADKAAFVRGLGADEVIEYGEIGGEIGGEVDVVLDSVGGAAQTRAINTLAPFGKLVSYGAAGAPVDVNELRLHARTVIGFAMAPFATRHPELYDRHRLELWDRYANGELIPAIHTTLALERAAEAHRIIESRRNQGKVILTP